MSRRLGDGIYEHVVTEDLARSLDSVESHRERVIDPLADADAHVVLARHVGREVERVLGSLPAEERAEAARALVGRLLDELGTLAGERGLDVEPVRDQRVPAPARRLLAIYRTVKPERPITPLSTSTLLTRNPSEPAIGHELAREIATADRIDVVVAFVTVGGIRRIRDQLEMFARRDQGERMRVLTTTFTGTTEIQALDQLAKLPGVSVKVRRSLRAVRDAGLRLTFRSPTSVRGEAPWLT